MERRIVKLIAAMTALALLAGSSAWAADTTRVYAINTDSELTSAQMEKENAANEAYTNLLESFRAAAPATHTRSDGREDANMADEASTAYTVDGIPADGFLDYYAGAYMNANHELVVMMTDNAAASKSAVRSLLQSSEMNFQTAEHSYADLVRCMDEITQGWSSGSEDFSPIQYAYIDDFGNRVVVGVKELSDEYLELLRTRLENFDATVFTECGDMAEAVELETEIITLNSRSKLLRSASSNPSTSPTEQFCFGFKAKKQINGIWKYGFVTAGHAISAGEYAVYLYQTNAFECIGQCLISFDQPINNPYAGASNPYVDAAFVEVINSDSDSPGDPDYADFLTSGSFNSERGDTTRTTSNTVKSLVQGSTVYKCGQITGETYGTVAMSSFSVNSGTVALYQDMVLATYTSEGGDSGAMTYELSSNGTTAYPAGIHIASVGKGLLTSWNVHPNIDQPEYKIYCKAGNVLVHLDISMGN